MIHHFNQRVTADAKMYHTLLYVKCTIIYDHICTQIWRSVSASGHGNVILNKLPRPTRVRSRRPQWVSMPLYHDRVFHEGIKVHVQCEHCGKKLKSKTNLYKHVLNIHDGIKQKHKCNDCENIFSSKSSLTEHVQNVHKGIKHKCEMCYKYFSMKSTLLRHYKSIH